MSIVRRNNHHSVLLHSSSLTLPNSGTARTFTACTHLRSLDVHQVAVVFIAWMLPYALTGVEIEVVQFPARRCTRLPSLRQWSNESLWCVQQQIERTEKVSPFALGACFKQSEGSKDSEQEPVHEHVCTFWAIHASSGSLSRSSCKNAAYSSMSLSVGT